MSAPPCNRIIILGLLTDRLLRHVKSLKNVSSIYCFGIPSPTVDELKKIFPKAKINILKCDESIKDITESVDLFIANFAFINNPDLTSILANTKRILAEKGIFIFSFLSTHTIEILKRAKLENTDNLLNEKKVLFKLKEMHLFKFISYKNRLMHSGELNADIDAYVVIAMNNLVSGKIGLELEFDEGEMTEEEIENVLSEKNEEEKEGGESEEDEEDEGEEGEEENEEEKEEETGKENEEAEEKEEVESSELEEETEKDLEIENETDEKETEKDEENESEDRENEGGEGEEGEAQKGEEKEEDEEEEDEEEEDEEDEEEEEKEEAEEFEDEAEEKEEKEEKESAEPVEKEEHEHIAHEEHKDQEENELPKHSYLLEQLEHNKEKLDQQSVRLQYHLESGAQILKRLAGNLTPAERESSQHALQNHYHEHKELINEYKQLHLQHSNLINDFMSAHVSALEKNPHEESNYAELIDEHKKALQEHDEKIAEHQDIFNVEPPLN